jgi:hypothetical protein
MPICHTVASHNIAAASLERSLAEEVRELHKLAMNCRAASLALFRNSAKHQAITNKTLQPVEANASRPDR